MTSYHQRSRWQDKSRPSDRPPPRLPEGYLEKGYFDDQGNTLPQVIVDWPKDIAQRLASGKLKTAQLRRFFNECRRIERRLDAGADFRIVRSEILKLDAYAADAVKKGKAPRLFEDFIKQNLKWAQKDNKAFLKGFIPHFESVVAYFPETT